MINEFQQKLFDEIASLSKGQATKEQVIDFFKHVEINKSHFENKGTFLSDYLFATAFAKFDKYIKELSDAGCQAMFSIQLLNTDFYHLEEQSDFNALVNEHIIIGDEDNTNEYFESMHTTDTFKMYWTYEMHFGRHQDLTRYGTLVFVDEKLDFPEKDFWKESQQDFDRFFLNQKLQETLPPKHKARPNKI